MRKLSQITGKGTLCHWEIVDDKNAPSQPCVLVQTSKENFGYHFNLAIIEEPISAKFELNDKGKLPLSIYTAEKKDVK
mgnify:CR=1 FL=1